MTPMVVKEVDPGLIIMDPSMNARFGLRAARIKSLAEDIKAAGGLFHPVGLYEHPDGKYSIKFGNYRVASVNLLNQEGAMMKIPATIHPLPEGERAKQEVLLANLMENMSRQDLTLMDQAAAMKALLDAGEDKMKVRVMFKRPGKKEPASNSWVNITLGFLDLPKRIQTMIHDGKYDWNGAAELVQVNRKDPSKLDHVLQLLEEAKAAEIARENREEERYLNTIKKAEESESKAKQAIQDQLDKAKEAEAKLEAAKAGLQAAKSEGASLLVEFEAKLKEATGRVVRDPAATGDVNKLTKELQAAREAAEKRTLKAQKELDSLVEKAKKDAEAAREKAKAKQAEAKAAAEEAKKAAEAKQPGGTAKKKAEAKPTGAADVKKAASKAGVTGAALVPLTRKQIMDVCALLSLPGGQGKAEKAVTVVGESLASCFNGGLTDKQCYSAILRAFANCGK